MAERSFRLNLAPRFCIFFRLAKDVCVKIISCKKTQTQSIFSPSRKITKKKIGTLFLACLQKKKKIRKIPQFTGARKEIQMDLYWGHEKIMNKNREFWVPLLDFLLYIFFDVVVPQCSLEKFIWMQWSTWGERNRDRARESESKRERQCPSAGSSSRCLQQLWCRSLQLDDPSPQCPCLPISLHEWQAGIWSWSWSWVVYPRPSNVGCWRCPWLPN